MYYINCDTLGEPDEFRAITIISQHRITGIDGIWHNAKVVPPYETHVEPKQTIRHILICPVDRRDTLEDVARSRDVVDVLVKTNGEIARHFDLNQTRAYGNGNLTLDAGGLLVTPRRDKL